MKATPSSSLAIAILAITLSAAAIAETAVIAQAPAANDAPPAQDVPLLHWDAPQLFNPVHGVSGSLPGFAAAGIHAKAALALATFIPIAPCRLVDTRGVFNPAIPSSGPFAAGETRVYRAPGNCAIPTGSNRVKAVSLAITTPPTAASGDIEAISAAATLGGTVVMVIQAGQWNSATTVSAVDPSGDFKVQLRGTPGHVVIDINGYYASPDASNLLDYVSIVGAYAFSGGVLYVENKSATGAAISAQGTDSSARLGFGSDALVLQGGVRVPNAGSGNANFVYVHKVTANNSCVLFLSPVTVLNHPSLNGNPDAIPFIGMGMTRYPGTATDGLDYDNAKLTYSGAGFPCGTTSTANRWFLIKDGGESPFVVNHAFPVMVITP